MVAENKRFKVKGHDTVYTVGDLINCHYNVTWTNSSGEARGALHTQYDVLKAFEVGDWYYTDTVSNTEETKSDAVNKPKHYAVFEQLEAIEVIASSMTTEQFYGYCLGNILKYRLRAGGKDDVMQELGKADRYQGLYNEFKHLCKAVA